MFMVGLGTTRLEGEHYARTNNHGRPNK
jgi:hypothetical protein